MRVNQNVSYMLERMSGEGVHPDRVMLVSVLTVCNHAGLVDTGHKHFDAMSKGLCPRFSV